MVSKMSAEDQILNNSGGSMLNWKAKTLKRGEPTLTGSTTEYRPCVPNLNFSRKTKQNKTRHH